MRRKKQRKRRRIVLSGIALCLVLLAALLLSHFGRRNADEGTHPGTDTTQNSSMSELPAGWSWQQMAEKDLSQGTLVLVNRDHAYDPELPQTVSVFDKKTQSYFVKDKILSLREDTADALNQWMDSLCTECVQAGLHRPLLCLPDHRHSALLHTLRVPHYPFAGSPPVGGILRSSCRPPFSLLRTYDCSALSTFFVVLWPLLTSHSSLLLREFFPPPVRPPRVLTRSFALIPALFTASDSVQLLGFGLAGSLTLAYGLARFLFVGPGFCPWRDLSALQIRLSSDSASRRTPLPLANASHCRARSGLSPYRTCAHRAHQQCLQTSFMAWRHFCSVKPLAKRVVQKSLWR